MIVLTGIRALVTSPHLQGDLQGLLKPFEALGERRIRDAEAEVFLTDMLGKDPGNASLYYNLGWVYSAQKKYKLGVDAFEKYLSLAPKDDSDRGKANAEIKSLKKKGGIR